ncbi:MAG TPA: ATP-binding protein [Ramlibacter sp.]|nr:ATP-binding protein [Ramlibacter sp.]
MSAVLPAIAPPAQDVHGTVLSTLPAGRREHLRAGAVLLVSVLVFLACAPFARVMLPPLPAFLPAYQSALVMGDLITAALLLGQLRMRRSPGLLLLACAYFFSACMAVLHALSFPGLFLPAGLPGGGPQTTAWLYFLWHAGFPLLVAAYALLEGKGDREPIRRPGMAMLLGAAAVLAGCLAAAWLATAGQPLLPSLMHADRDAPAKFGVAIACWLLSIGTLPLLWRRKPHTALDLWLLVVMCAWIFEVALAAVLNGGRYDLGWYAGRVYGLLAAGFVLIVLLLDNAVLYDDLARAHALERSIGEELRQAKAAADAAAQAKAQFLANMSHEIRTPMNAILGMTQLALKGELPERQRGYLEKSLRAGRHLLAVINDILDLSKSEAGQLTVEAIDFDLEQTLTSVVEMVGQKAGDKGLELIVDVDPGVPRMLHGDPLRLGQVLVNLANNAVKFTDRGEVALVCRREPDTGDGVRLRFEVRDTGIGIPPEQRTHLFQPFRQSDESITRRFGGTGLGLTISRRLVSLMGGEMGLVSQPGWGSTFWFTVLAGHSKQQPAPPPAAERLQGRRILVVDDHEYAGGVIAHLLRSMRFEVLKATSGEEALDCIARADGEGRPFDAAVLDWQMPRMDGLEVARRVGAMGLRRPPALLLVTAFGREETVTGAKAVGIREVLIKPVNPSLLFDSLASALNGAARPEPTAAPTLRPPTPLPGAPRVLVVEDHPVNREVAQGLLALQGVHVDLAVDGQDAVDRLRRAPDGRWHLIFMDMQMPVLDGLAATRAIRAMERYRDLPIVAMTANALPGDRDRCLGAGMVDHIAKPIDEQELAQVLQRWLRRDRAGEAAVGAAAEEPMAVPVSPAGSEFEALEHAVAHDLRAAMGVVGGFGTLLRAQLGPALDDRTAGHVSALRDTAREVTGLVDAWRRAGKVLRQPMELQLLDVPAMVRRVAEQLQADGLELDLDRIPAVHADADLLERVWRELLGNAAKFVAPGERPRVSVSGRPAGPDVVFAVRDHGIGIPAADADRLFQPLQRLHGDAYPGTGLGLFVASRLVARHGGAMWRETATTGRGTTICFRLPRLA